MSMSQRGNITEFIRDILQSELSITLPTALIFLMVEYALGDNPAEYVKANFAGDRDKLARYCESLFSQNVQNGVSCALNGLEEKQRQELLTDWKKNHPWLAAYYTSQREWSLSSSSQDPTYAELAKRAMEEKNPAVPARLLHALQVKRMLFDFKCSVEEAKIPFVNKEFWNEFQKLLHIPEGTLHLNLRGAYFSDELVLENLDLSTLDISQINYSLVMDMPGWGLTLRKCSLRRTDFSGLGMPKFRMESCDCSDAIFDGVKVTWIWRIEECQLAGASWVGGDFQHGRLACMGLDFRKARVDEAFLKYQQEQLNSAQDIRQGLNWYPAYQKFVALGKSNQSQADILLMLWLGNNDTSKFFVPNVQSLKEEDWQGVSAEFRTAILAAVKAVPAAPAASAPTAAPQTVPSPAAPQPASLIRYVLTAPQRLYSAVTNAWSGSDQKDAKDKKDEPKGPPPP